MVSERGVDEVMPLTAGAWRYQVTLNKHMKNQADLPLVTLDNNVLIALRGNEPDTHAAQVLLELNRLGLICLNVTMSTAMEAQRPGEHVEWSEAIARIERLGIPRENISLPLARLALRCRVCQTPPTLIFSWNSRLLSVFTRSYVLP
jgi:hypothetical protein